MVFNDNDNIFIDVEYMISTEFISIINLKIYVGLYHLKTRVISVNVLLK
jgi:hypothetical protein